MPVTSLGQRRLEALKASTMVVAARGATFKALDRKWLDLTTPIGRGILAVLSSLAEDKRARILARANGGRAAAKKRGVKFGPKPKLAAH
jgi:DNA invertase Pin-like site-specific DNA recombinase